MQKKRKWLKWLLIGGGVVIVAVIIVMNLRPSGRGTSIVQTKKVEKIDIISQVSGSGRVQPKTKVNVTSEATAEIIRIPAKEGDFVRRGQTLIQLDTVQLKRDLESYLYTANETESYVEAAKVVLDQARDEYNRQKGLFEKKLTSEQVYTNAEYAYREQEATYGAMLQQKNAAFARLDKARDLLSKTTIKAPMDGIITLVDAEVGEIAQAQTPYSQGKTLMVVSDLSAFEVEVEIDETDVAELKLNQKAKVEIDAFPDTIFAGRVIEIGNTASTTGFGTSDQATNFKVKVALEEMDQKIRPGMSATVDIVTDERQEVLATLIQAVVMRKPDPDSLAAKSEEGKKETEGEAPKEGDEVAHASEVPDSGVAVEKDDKKIEKKGVFVVRDAVAHFVEIETGIADQQNIEVASGLEEGDEVITGSFKTLRTIKDGDKVKVVNKTEHEGPME